MARKQYWKGVYRVGPYNDEKLTLGIFLEDPEPPTGPWRIIFWVPYEGEVPYAITTFRDIESAKIGAEAICHKKYHDRVAQRFSLGKVHWGGPLIEP